MCDLARDSAAALMSAASGLPIRFQDETDDHAVASRAPLGAPRCAIEGWISSYHAIRDGSLSAITDDVRRLTHQAPMTFAEYLRRFPRALPHVAPVR